MFYKHISQFVTFTSSNLFFIFLRRMEKERVCSGPWRFCCVPAASSGPPRVAHVILPIPPFCLQPLMSSSLLPHYVRTYCLRLLVRRSRSHSIPNKVEGTGLRCRITLLNWVCKSRLLRAVKFQALTRRFAQ